MAELEQTINVVGFQTASKNLTSTFNGLEEAEELNYAAKELILMLKYVEVAFVRSSKKYLKLFQQNIL